MNRQLFFSFFTVKPLFGKVEEKITKLSDKDKHFKT